MLVWTVREVWYWILGSIWRSFNSYWSLVLYVSWLGLYSLSYLQHLIRHSGVSHTSLAESKYWGKTVHWSVLLCTRDGRLVHVNWRLCVRQGGARWGDKWGVTTGKCCTILSLSLRWLKLKSLYTGHVCMSLILGGDSQNPVASILYSCLGSRGAQVIEQVHPLVNNNQGHSSADK